MISRLVVSNLYKNTFSVLITIPIRGTLGVYRCGGRLIILEHIIEMLIGILVAHLAHENEIENRLIEFWVIRYECHMVSSDIRYINIVEIVLKSYQVSELTYTLFHSTVDFTTVMDDLSQFIVGTETIKGLY